MVYGLNSTLAIADVLGAILGQDLKKNLYPLVFETDTSLHKALAQDEPIELDNISVVQLATLG
jgi:hypothetical protein